MPFLRAKSGMRNVQAGTACGIHHSKEAVQESLGKVEAVVNVGTSVFACKFQAPRTGSKSLVTASKERNFG
jgi:hypothetical protein